jgi:hypothetical protein
MNLSEDAIGIYESLRKQVLEHEAPSQELQIIVYHGFLRGLQILTTQSIKPIFHKDNHEVSQSSSLLDIGLIRFIANIILCSQTEVMHVY